MLLSRRPPVVSELEVTDRVRLRLAVDCLASGAAWFAVAAVAAEAAAAVANETRREAMVVGPSVSEARCVQLTGRADDYTSLISDVILLVGGEGVGDGGAGEPK